MVIQRLNFRFSECYNEREIEAVLEQVTERGAKYHEGPGPNFHLDIPKGFDFLPFYQTLNECESVAWVATQTYSVIILKDIGVEE